MLRYYYKPQWVDNSNDVLWIVYQKLVEGDEKLIKIFKTRRGAVNHTAFLNRYKTHKESKA